MHKNTLCLYFGATKIWHLQFHVVCATLNTLRYVQKTLTDTDFIDEDVADSEREIDLLTEMIRQSVMQNVSASVCPRRRSVDLCDPQRLPKANQKTEQPPDWVAVLFFVLYSQFRYHSEKVNKIKAFSAFGVISCAS